jgi:hypothetical protein
MSSPSPGRGCGRDQKPNASPSNVATGPTRVTGRSHVSRMPSTFCLPHSPRHDAEVGNAAPSEPAPDWSAKHGPDFPGKPRSNNFSASVPQWSSSSAGPRIGTMTETAAVTLRGKPHHHLNVRARKPSPRISRMIIRKSHDPS